MLNLECGLTLETGLIDKLIKDTVNGKRHWKRKRDRLISLGDEFNVSFCPSINMFGDPIIKAHVFAKEKGRDAIEIIKEEKLWHKFKELEQVVNDIDLQIK